MPKKLIMFLVIICVNFSCRYDDLSKKPKVKEDHGFVIGFNPCEQYTGRVIALTTEQDTIISYNFPNPIYTFPSSFFSAYRHRYLFPDSVLDKYPINITYRLVESSEKEYFLCSGAINTASFLHDVKDRQPLFLLGSGTLSFLSLNQEEKFYYAFSEKIKLREDRSKIVVRFKTAKKLNFQNAGDWKDDRTVVLGNQAGITDEIASKGEIISQSYLYELSDGSEIFLTDEVILKGKHGIDPGALENLLAKFNAKHLKHSAIYDLYSVTNFDVLTVANTLQESGLVEFAHPNFILSAHLDSSIPNDTYFQYQFMFHNTGQTINDGLSGTADTDIDLPEAWDISTGSSNAIIAVLDEGVSSDHPDLPNTRQLRLNGSNFANGDANDPKPRSNKNAHGDAVAGLVAASSNNSQGTTGFVPDVK